MNHLDGINFSNDQVTAYPDLPLMYNMSEWEGRPILTANNEYPRSKAMKYDGELPPVSTRNLVKKIVDPTIPKDTFCGNRSPVMSIMDRQFSNQDILYIILIIILAIMISFQIRVQSQVQTMMSLMPYMRSHT
jgi:hypothetical protein